MAVPVAKGRPQCAPRQPPPVSGLPRGGLCASGPAALWELPPPRTLPIARLTLDATFFDLTIADNLRMNDRLVIDGGQTLEREDVNVVKATGERRTHWTVKTPIRDGTGRIIAMCGISTDITERKRA